MIASLSNNQPHNLVGYEIFLPEMAAALVSKEKKDKSLSDAEFRSIVAIIFRDAMIQFCKDSRLYQVDVPIDFYEGTRQYQITPPEGFATVAIIEVMDGAYKKNNRIIYDLDNLILPKDACITKDTPRALWLKLAIKPTRSNLHCKFNKVFIDRYYEEIKLLMFYLLHMQDQRVWSDLGRADRYYRAYGIAVDRARRNNSGINNAVKLKGYALTDVRHSYNK